MIVSGIALGLFEDDTRIIVFVFNTSKLIGVECRIEGMLVNLMTLDEQVLLRSIGANDNDDICFSLLTGLKPSAIEFVALLHEASA
jgi:hypothetical protein